MHTYLFKNIKIELHHSLAGGLNRHPCYVRRWDCEMLSILLSCDIVVELGHVYGPIDFGT